jgi:hypothetical protein
MRGRSPVEVLLWLVVFLVLVFLAVKLINAL